MSEKITVSGEKFISTLREVAADNPDYVYKVPDALAHSESYSEGSCYYVHPSPAGPVAGCIIGATLVRLGVPLAALAENENESAHRVMDEVLNLTGPQADAARTMADITQDAQDGSYGARSTWADAVAKGGLGARLVAA